MKKLFALTLVFIAFAALVVMPPGNTVKAYEYETIETLECDLTIINDVEFEITKTVYPVMIVEVEISPGDVIENTVNKNLKGYSVEDFIKVSKLIADNCGVKSKDLIDACNILAKKSCKLTLSTERYSKQAIVNKEFEENYNWYNSNNYLTSLIWQYSEWNSPDNYPKLRTNEDRWKFYNIQQEVGIVTGVNLGLQLA